MSVNDTDLALARMDDDGWGCAITTEKTRLIRWYARENAPVIKDKYSGEQGVVVIEEDAGYWVDPIPGTTSWTVSRPVIPAFWPRLLVSRLRYIARFTPEAWIRDYAVEVDAPGPQEWDCTSFASTRLDYLGKVGRRRHERLDDPDGVLDNDDVFQCDPAAPAWVREWSGPFTIRIRTEEG